VIRRHNAHSFADNVSLCFPMRLSVSR
jgi:hypothetical protein